MRHYIFGFLFFPLLCIVSCQRSSDSAKLIEADRIIETSPQKAFDILSEVRRGNLSESDNALYCLLMTQAQYKTGIFVDSDSLIRTAYDYFRFHGSDNHRLRAYYYNANVSYLAEDCPAAMKDVLMAYELAKDLKDPYWIGRSAELISDIYFESYNIAEAEKYNLEASRSFLKANHVSAHKYSMVDRAIIYQNQGKGRRAKEILDSMYAIAISDPQPDSIFLEYLRGPLVTARLATNSLQEIEEKDIAVDSIHPLKKVDDLLTQSEYYRLSGNFEKSLLALDKIKWTNIGHHAQLLYAYYLHYKDAGQFEDAVALTDSLILIQSEITNKMLQESVAGVQRDFYSNLSEKHHQRSKALIVWLVVAIAVGAFVSVLLFVIHKLKMKNRQAELELIAGSFREMKHQVEVMDLNNKILSQRLKTESENYKTVQKELDAKSDIETRSAGVIENLFKEKWTTLNMLCNNYFEMGGSANTRSAILKNIETEIQKQSTRKNLAEIESAVNLYMGGIMSQLRKECDFLKEDDFTFISLVYAGLSVRAICLFTGIKYKNYYLKKSRLYKRIESSNAPSKELFLQHLK